MRRQIQLSTLHSTRTVLRDARSGVRPCLVSDLVSDPSQRPNWFKDWIFLTFLSNSETLFESKFEIPDKAMRTTTPRAGSPRAISRSRTSSRCGQVRGRRGGLLCRFPFRTRAGYLSELLYAKLSDSHRPGRVLSSWSRSPRAAARAGGWSRDAALAQNRGIVRGSGERLLDALSLPANR
jgi:hypothetical protein